MVLLGSSLSGYTPLHGHEKDNSRSFFNSHGRMLFLLQPLSQMRTATQELLGGSIKTGTKLSKNSNLVRLSQFQLHGTVTEQSQDFDCLSPRKPTHKVDTGIKGKEGFIQVLHHLGEWRTPVPKPSPSQDQTKARTHSSYSNLK